jgi:hypothetical protein
MGDDRAGRVAVNEAMFREINERIESIGDGLGVGTGTISAVCECGELMCVEQMQVTLGEYERIRRDPALFMLVPGHELPDVEEVVDRVDGYNVVRKDPGEGERIAEATDPRG